MPEPFSRRSDWPAGSERLSELADRYRRSGEDWIDLTASNPTRCDLGLWDADSLTALSDPANLVYDPDPKGSIQARKSVADYYASKGAAVDPDHIILTSGTSEAYQLVLRLLTEPGQTVLTPAPSYPLIDLLLDLNDVRQERYQLRCDPAVIDPLRNGWTFDAGSARAALASDPRAIIAIHANNPTGHTFGPAERSALIDLAKARGTPLIVDEVFLDYSGRPDATFAAEPSVLTFTLSGISKVLGLPQMKLSWIVVSGPEAQRQEALRRLEIMADVFLSVGTPVQTALGAWMRGVGTAQERIRKRIEGNRSFLVHTLTAGTGLTPLPCAGGWTAVLRLTDGSDDEAFAFERLERHKVLAHPGYLFDFASGSHLVLSLLPPRGAFEEGLLRLVRPTGRSSSIRIF